ncbi:restriction endonuclease subunit S [Microbacterium aurum]
MTWETVRLGDVADVVSGATPKTDVPEYWGGSVAWATPAEISKLVDKYISRTERTLTQLGLASSGAKLLPPNSVLLSSRAPIGLVAINTVPMATNQGFKSLVPSERILPTYLYWWLESHTAVLQSRGRGATFLELSKSEVERVSLPLPPLPEQRRIAAILDEADALRALNQRQSEAIDSLVAAAFESVLTHSSGSLTTIAALVESSQYGTSAKAGPTGTYPILRMGNITSDGRIDLSDMKYINLEAKERSKYLVRSGDVLFNRTNSADLVGKTAVYREDEPRAFAGYLVRLRPKEPEFGDYVSGYLNSRVGKLTLRKMAKSIVGMANINAREVQAIRLPVPESTALKRFVAIREIADSQRRALAARTHELDALFASLQHRAFRGEL